MSLVSIKNSAHNVNTSTRRIKNTQRGSYDATEARLLAYDPVRNTMCIAVTIAHRWPHVGWEVDRGGNFILVLSPRPGMAYEDDPHPSPSRLRFELGRGWHVVRHDLDKETLWVWLRLGLADKKTNRRTR